MVHLPAGTSQFRVPSGAIREVKSTMSERRITASAGTGGVGVVSYSNRKLKPALSSQRWTRAPACSATSERTYSLAGFGGGCDITSAGVIGAPLNSTR